MSRGPLAGKHRGTRSAICKLQMQIVERGTHVAGKTAGEKHPNLERERGLPRKHAHRVIWLLRVQPPKTLGQERAGSWPSWVGWGAVIARVPYAAAAEADRHADTDHIKRVRGDVCLYHSRSPRTPAAPDIVWIHGSVNRIPMQTSLRRTPMPSTTVVPRTGMAIRSRRYDSMRSVAITAPLLSIVHCASHLGDRAVDFPRMWSQPDRYCGYRFIRSEL